MTKTISSKEASQKLEELLDDLRSEMMSQS